jgi:hypothetical protein
MEQAKRRKEEEKAKLREEDERLEKMMQQDRDKLDK